MALIGISGKIGSGKDTVGKIIQIIYNLPHFNVKAVEGFLNREIYTEKDSFHIKKFADKLKDIVCILIGCTREQLEDREFKEKELGEEWRIWYMTHYKLSNNHHDGKIGKIYSSEEEILEYESSEFFENLRLEGYQIVSKILTPRLLLQLLGTECGRQILHPNIWVNALFTDYGARECSKEEANDVVLIGKHEVPVKYPNWIITDVRFPNEAKVIKDKGGILIRVDRLIGKNVYVIENEQPFQNWYGVIESYNGNNFYNVIDNNENVILVHKNQITLLNEHESETALDNYQDWDYVIENNTDIVGLTQKVKDILLIEDIIK